MIKTDLWYRQELFAAARMELEYIFVIILNYEIMQNALIDYHPISRNLVIASDIFQKLHWVKVTCIKAGISITQIIYPLALLR